MKHLFSILLLSFSTILIAQTEMKYNSESEKLPNWAELMYSENPDDGKVIKLYKEFYKTNEFVKNKHTQYYKRWTRNISRYTNSINENSTSKSSNQWECIGPWDFDQHAASRSYAPGAAHVYTVEQALSNNNVIYAGTATAGAWKSIDKGMNWELLTADLILGGVYAIEIDFTDYNNFVHFCRFEMLKASPELGNPEEFSKMLEFYEIQLSQKKISEIIEKTRAKGTMVRNLYKVALLPWAFSTNFRSGKTGGWREEFTVNNKKHFKKLAGDFLIELGYEKNNNW